MPQADTWGAFWVCLFRQQGKGKFGGRKRCGNCRSCGKTKERFSHSSLNLRFTVPTTPTAAGPSSNTTFLLLPTSNRTRSREVPGSAAVDDASGSGRTDGPGLRADHRRRGAVSVREASGELCWSSSDRRVQRRSTKVRTYQHARQQPIAFLHGRSGAGNGTERSGMAEQVFSSRHAPRTEDR